MGKAIYLFVTGYLLCLFCTGAQAQSINIVPRNGYPGKQVPYTVLGSGTHFKVNPKTLSIRLISDADTSFICTAQSVNVLSDIQVSFFLNLPSNAPVAWYDLDIRDSVDGHIIHRGIFYVEKVLKPYFTVVPDTIRAGQAIPIHINGTQTYFNYPFGKPKVWLQKNAKVITTTVGAHTSQYYMAADVSIPQNAAAGVYDVYVSDSIDSVMVAPNAITITHNPLPDVVRIDPPGLERGLVSSFDIQGTNCHFNAGVYDSYPFMLANGTDTIPVNNLQHLYADSAKVTFYIPFTTDTGLYSVIINNIYDGMWIPSKKVRILKNPDRRILSFTPNRAYPGSRFVMTIKVSNTRFRSRQTRVWLSQAGLILHPQNIHIINDEIVEAYFVLSSNVLISSGTWEVHTEDLKDRDIVSDDVFTIPFPVDPVIISVSPDTILRNTNNVLHIIGQNSSFNAGTHFFLNDKYGITENLTVDNVISPTEATAHINPGTAMVSGPVYLSYDDTAEFEVKLDNPLYITDTPAPWPQYKVSLVFADTSDGLGAHIFPNPFADYFSVSYYLKEQAEVTADVFDMMGRPVFSENPAIKQEGYNETKLCLDHTKYPQGMYTVRVSASGYASVLKIVKL